MFGEVGEGPGLKRVLKRAMDRASSPRWPVLEILPRAMPWAGMRRAVGAIPKGNDKDSGPGRSIGREADLSTALFTVRL